MPPTAYDQVAQPSYYVPGYRPQDPSLYSTRFQLQVKPPPQFFAQPQQYVAAPQAYFAQPQQYVNPPQFVPKQIPTTPAPPAQNTGPKDYEASQYYNVELRPQSQAVKPSEGPQQVRLLQSFSSQPELIPRALPKPVTTTTAPRTTTTTTTTTTPMPPAARAIESATPAPEGIIAVEGLAVDVPSKPSDVGFSFAFNRPVYFYIPYPVYNIQTTGGNENSQVPSEAATEPQSPRANSNLASSAVRTPPRVQLPGPLNNLLNGPGPYVTQLTPDFFQQPTLGKSSPGSFPGMMTNAVRANSL